MSARGRCLALEGTCGLLPVAVERDGQVRCLTHATDPSASGAAKVGTWPVFTRRLLHQWGEADLPTVLAVA
jgi:hypothetical protein